MSAEDRFWKVARRRVVYWLTTAIRLAGHEVNPLSMLEALRSASTQETHAREGYLARCLANAGRRYLTGQLNQSDKDIFMACAAFWNDEFFNLAPNTRSCIVFDVMTKLEEIVYGLDPPDFLSPEDAESWEFL
jgi:hypothetical protein